jgi:hypothetical protein
MGTRAFTLPLFLKMLNNYTAKFSVGGANDPHPGCPVLAVDYLWTILALALTLAFGNIG